VNFKKRDSFLLKLEERLKRGGAFSFQAQSRAAAALPGSAGKSGVLDRSPGGLFRGSFFFVFCGVGTSGSARFAGRAAMVLKGKVKFDTRLLDDFDAEKPYADPVRRSSRSSASSWFGEKWIAIEKAKGAAGSSEGVLHQGRGRTTTGNARIFPRSILESIKHLGWGKDTRLHVLYSSDSPS